MMNNTFTFIFTFIVILFMLGVIYGSLSAIEDRVNQCAEILNER